MFKRLFLIIVVLISFCATNAQLNDDFSDGDLENPLWTGETFNFVVNDDFQLQLNDDEAAQSEIMSAFPSSTLNDKEWRIWVKQSFSGSDNNHSRIYLSSQTGMLDYSGTTGSGAEGYFLQLGESGSEDAIKLYRDDTNGGSVTLVAEGTPGLISSSFEIRIQVTRDDAGNWSLFVDETGGENFSLEATGMDDTYSSSENFGIVCRYTVSNSTDFYFDDVFFGDPVVDTEPPELTSISVVDNTHLNLFFNEPLDQVTAEETSNYGVVGFGTPSFAELDGGDPTLVHLTFSTPFEANVEYTLDINGVEDLFGNAISTSDNFTWVSFGTPGFRSIVFNEIMADPTPEVGLPEAEFVELYNAGDEIYQLENYEFVNSETVKVLPPFELSAGEYVILCDDDDQLEMEVYGPVIGIGSFTALSNAGDSLTLKDAEGNIIDIVSYTDNWYQDPDKDDGGWTLEQINPEAACNGPSNWAASTDPNGGTPGSENSLFNSSSDETPPEIVFVSAGGTNSLFIQFDEPLDSESIGIEDFELDPSNTVTGFELSSGLQSVTLIFQDEILIGVPYTLSYSGIGDCSGNEVTGSVYDFVLGQEPGFKMLIINEIMADPDESIPSPNAEYIELFNRSDEVLDLTGVTLSGASFIEATTMDPGSYLIVFDADELPLFVAYSNAAPMMSFPTLTNSGRELELLNSSEEVIDYLEYSDDWYGDPDKDDGGWSLELINPEDPCSDGSNWTASQAIYGATAGTMNSVFSDDIDSSPPIPLYPLINSPSEIEIVFDEPLLESGNVTDQWSIFFDPDILADVEVVEATTSGYSVLISLSSGLTQGAVYRLNETGTKDCWENESGGSSLLIALPEEVESGDLILNEILFNPREDGSDYVEILNRSTKNISLEGWLIANFDDGIIDNFSPISELPRLILAGEHLAFTTDPSTVNLDYPGSELESILKVESLPSFTNDSGTVYLFSPELELSDRFSYSEEMHFGLIDDVEGVSLERIDPFLDFGSGDNWHSAAESVNFGTPGYLNSQSRPGAMTNVELSIEPEVFSPDNDGFDDVAIIKYTSEQPGNVANITVYDRNGRTTNELVRNELLGTSTQFIWDGTRDDGSKAEIGIYIILVELFDLDGNTSQNKLTCVLGHKLD